MLRAGRAGSLGFAQVASNTRENGLIQRIIEFIQRAIHFVRDELWDAEPEPRTAYARALAVLQFTVMIGQGFVRDQLLLRASALTYFTVLSIVPLLAIMVSIASAFG